MSHEPSPPAALAEEPAWARTAAFSVQDEGEALGLYLSAWTLAGLAASLELADEVPAVVLYGHTRTPVPWALAARLRGGLEVVVGRLGSRVLVEDLPDPLLADPAGALRAGARRAVCVQATGEVVLCSRDTDLLKRALLGFLQAAVAKQCPEGSVSPPVAPALVEPLLAVQPPGVWTRVRLQPARRYWTLELETSASGSGTAVSQWVCEGPEGRWRAGWSW